MKEHVVIVVATRANTIKEMMVVISAVFILGALALVLSACCALGV